MAKYKRKQKDPLQRIFLVGSGSFVTPVDHYFGIRELKNLNTLIASMVSDTQTVRVHKAQVHFEMQPGDDFRYFALTPVSIFSASGTTFTASYGDVNENTIDFLTDTAVDKPFAIKVGKTVHINKADGICKFTYDVTKECKAVTEIVELNEDNLTEVRLAMHCVQETNKTIYYGYVLVIDFEVEQKRPTQFLRGI